MVGVPAVVAAVPDAPVPGVEQELGLVLAGYLPPRPGRLRLGGVHGDGPLSAPAHHRPPAGARECGDRGLVCHALEAAQGVREAAQGPLVLALLLVSMPLGLLGLGLGGPGLLSLLGLRLRLGLPLLGAALGLLGLVARQGAVGFLGLAYGFLRHIGLHSRVVFVALDAREGQDSYTPVRVWLPGAASRDPRKSNLTLQPLVA